MAGIAFQQVNGSVLATGIVAGTTQTSAGATALTARNNVIATVGTTNDGVRLPSAAIGDDIYVYNAGANTARIYPSTGGTINGGSADSPVTLATTKAAVYRCVAADTFYQLPGA